MKSTALNHTLALGAITGMRSLAGLAAYARKRDGVLMQVVMTMAAGEMIADKTSIVGDRIDPIPLAGRACLGALVGGLIAREEHGDILAGAVVGAATAVIVAHLAFRVRRWLPLPAALSGVIEDAIVMGVGASYAPSTSAGT